MIRKKLNALFIALMNTWNSKYVDQLKTLISYPSISSNPSAKKSIIDCASWLVNHLREIGLKNARIFSTTSHPVVYAEYISSPSNATILFYGHYDVQPTDPIEKWHSHPFQALIKENYIYGRGASDDKGQLLIHIKAIERLLRQNKELPVNIKFLIEGAEEIGSAGLQEFINSHQSMLRCHVAVVSDTKMASLNTPAITYSLRGALNAEVFIQTSTKDLHSGTFGGCSLNAGIVLSEFIYQLHDKNSMIKIPGFYDEVETVTAQERAMMKSAGPNDYDMKMDMESKSDWGEKAYSMYEKTTIRPSLSITGITSGFQGEGVKNVIPSAASVKLNLRLVPGQRPEKIRLLLDRFIRSVIPVHVSVKTTYTSFANPIMVSLKNPYIKAAANAYESVFKQKTKFIRAGGTIAAVDFISTILHVPVVLMGFAQAGDNMHAPNEKFYLPNFFRGIDTSILFIKNVAKIIPGNAIVRNAIKSNPHAGY